MPPNAPTSKSADIARNDDSAACPGVESDVSPEITAQLTPDDSLLAPLSTNTREYVVAVLHLNAHSGRAVRVMARMRASRQIFTQFWDRAIEYAPTLPWEILWLAYQHRVLTVFAGDSERILALHHHNELAWRTLAQQLTSKAIHLLLRAGVGMGCACDRAAEMAQQTCVCALAHTYPCDVPLDYWLYTILRNVNLQVWTRSQDLLDRDQTIDSLEDMQDRGVNVATRSFMCAAANHSAKDPAHSSAQMDALIHAINQMQSEERRLVVAYTYFADMTDDEIAARLHKSKAVVHILRHRAIKQLRSLIED
jgi:RNA polymerase sigma factor (sigma-70 family)